MKKILLFIVIIAALSLAGCFGGSKEVETDLELTNNNSGTNLEELKKDDLMVEYEKLVKRQNEISEDMKVENVIVLEEEMKEFDEIIDRLKELEIELKGQKDKKRSASSNWLNTVKAKLRNDGNGVDVSWGNRKDDTCYYLDIGINEYYGSNGVQYKRLLARDEVFSYRIPYEMIKTVTKIKVYVKWRHYEKKWYGTTVTTKWDRKEISLNIFEDSNFRYGCANYDGARLEGYNKADFVGDGIRSISGIQYLKSLEYINLDDNYIEDLTPIVYGNLPELRVLKIGDNDLNSIRDFEKYSSGQNTEKLEYLYIDRDSFKSEGQFQRIEEAKDYFRNYKKNWIILSDFYQNPGIWNNVVENYEFNSDSSHVNKTIIKKFTKTNAKKIKLYISNLNLKSDSSLKVYSGICMGAINTKFTKGDNGNHILEFPGNSVSVNFYTPNTLGIGSSYNVEKVEYFYLED